MFSWLVGQYLRFNIRRLLAGDVDGLLRQFHPNAELIFPGRTSFSGTFRGREAVGAWLRRFVSLRPEYIVHDVLVAGPPWNMRIAYRMTDRIGSHYSNEAMVYLRFRCSARCMSECSSTPSWSASGSATIPRRRGGN